MRKSRQRGNQRQTDNKYRLGSEWTRRPGGWSKRFPSLWRCGGSDAPLGQQVIGFTQGNCLLLRSRSRVRHRQQKGQWPHFRYLADTPSKVGSVRSGCGLRVPRSSPVAREKNLALTSNFLALASSLGLQRSRLQTGTSPQTREKKPRRTLR